MSDDNFFDNIFSGSSGSIDAFLQGRDLEGDYYNSVRTIVQRQAGDDGVLTGFDLPLTAGTRVAFVSTLESMFTYGNNYPGPDMGGSVVTVRSAHGDTTSTDGRAYVLWDDGAMRSILAQHLRFEPRVEGAKMAKTGPVVRIVTGQLADLSQHFQQSNVRPNELVHKATRDIWSFGTDPKGNYVIERLFNDSGATVKG